MERLRIVHSTNGLESLALQELHAAMQRESTLLHPTLSSLEQSFQDGRAIALLDGERAVGYIRFTPLVDDRMRGALAVSPECPDIWEIGSAIILPEDAYRGRGFFSSLRNSLLATVQNEIRQERLLILGTTKTIKVITVLDKAQALGITFYQSAHTEFPMIAPLTCVCNPDFGCGFHIASHCPQRVTPSQLKELPVLAQASSDGTKIPCTMYVSSRPLAAHIDEALRIRFAQDNRECPQQALIDSLKRIDYYG